VPFAYSTTPEVSTTYVIVMNRIARLDAWGGGSWGKSSLRTRMSELGVAAGESRAGGPFCAGRGWCDTACARRVRFDPIVR